MTDLAQSIDQFWQLCRTALKDELELEKLPTELGTLIQQYARKEVKQKDVRIVKNVNLKQIEDRKRQKQAQEVLKLFDSSANGYRSATNVLLEYLKLQQDLDAGTFDLAVADYAALDGVMLNALPQLKNAKRCPICNRFPQTAQVYALLSGNPQTDSLYQTYQNKPEKRANMKVCQYCFTAGWVDLPASKIDKPGQQINKGREFLFITTPMSEKKLKALLDALVHVKALPDEEDEVAELPPLDPLALFMQENNIGRDPISVLGVSKTRLKELRGFVLQSANKLLRTMVVRVPIERLVGDEKVGGAVRRELIKATMYDFWQIVGGSLHYERIVEDANFSVDGQIITVEEMRRAALAFQIADRHARVGKYRQLNSGLFMLLLHKPRQAVTRIFLQKRRGKFPPNTKTVREIIDMSEQIANYEDWQFKLGLRIAELLVNNRYSKGARGFWKPDGGQYSGVDLVKWFQRLKMLRDDPNSVRQWGTSLINGYKRSNDNRSPNQKVVAEIMELVELIIVECDAHDTPYSQFARTIANMDYYLLFYYNHFIKPEFQEEPA